jgi:predicted acyltransferase
LLLQSVKVAAWRKVACLVGFGVAGVVLGFLWGHQLPVIKKIWTSSYVLVAAGYSALLLAAFYLVVDVLRLHAWCQPFVWIGMNPITIYLLENFLDYGRLAARLAGGSIEAALNAHVAQGVGDLTTALVGLLLAFWLAHFLYRRKVFLRL